MWKDFAFLARNRNKTHRFINTLCWLGYIDPKKKACPINILNFEKKKRELGSNFFTPPHPLSSFTHDKT